MMKKSLTIVSIVIIFILVVLVVKILTPYGSATTPDSLSYLDIATNIKNGNGARATYFGLENTDRTTFIENRFWPPLYPALLSIVINHSSDVITTAHLSMGLLFISALLVYLILISYTHWYIALLSSLLLCMTSPIITVYTYAWSETLFIPLLLLATWSSIKYLEIDNTRLIQKITVLSVLLVSLILLAYTRYIGIIFFVLIPFLYLMSKKGKNDSLRFFLIAIIYLVFIGYLLLDNYLVTHSITGGVRMPSNKTLLENIIDSFTVLFTILPTSSPFVILTLIIVTAGTIYIKSKVDDSGHHVKDNNNGYYLLIFLFIGGMYIMSIIILRTYHQFDQLDVRLLAPAFPLVWMLLFILISRNRMSNKREITTYFLSIFLVLAFPVTGYNQLTQSIENWKNYASPRHPLRGEWVYNNFTRPVNNNQIRTLFSELISGNAVMISKKPLIFEFMFGIKNVQQPTTIDLETFHQINRLPEGSLFIYAKNEENPFSALLADHKIVYEYLDIGNMVAIKIPMSISQK